MTHCGGVGGAAPAGLAEAVELRWLWDAHDLASGGLGTVQAEGVSIW